MSQGNISTWLQFALQQMAAESYLDQLTSGRQLKDILTDGNNDIRVISSELFSGKTRFTDQLTSYFVPTPGSSARYQIVDHHANDASGFSATLIFDRDTNSYTLSFRSTEYRHQSEGGDWERDGLFAADGEIGAHGFAFGQLAAMESYYLQLKSSQKLPSGSTLNVTGYSLGGHLATVFTELHAAEIDHTYIFNGAGRGHVEGADSSLVAEEARIRAMLDYFRVVLNDPDMANPRFSRDSPIYDAAIVSHAADPGWDPFDQGTPNFYSDPRYQWAKAATLWQFDTEGISSIELTTNFLGEPRASGPFSKITALYGLAATGDLNVVANSGVHAAGAQPILIEGQPQIEGVLLFQDQAVFGNTHSIILIVDSLAVQELIHTIDFRYGQASAELLIKAASNAKAHAIAPLVTPGLVEGDSLERTVDTFRKLFLGPTLPEPYPLPVDSQVGGFGNLANRNEMYVAMASVRQALQGWQEAGAIFTLTDLTDMSSLQSSEATSPENIAQAETAQGLAYRYALKELNPFALWADDDRVTDVLYEAHNTAGELDLFNEATGTGTLTAQYLADRAQFLAEKIALNLGDRETSSGNIHFADYVVGNDDAISQIRYQIETGGNIQTHQEFLFGSNGLDRLEGGSNEDHLYGGGGVDLLIGNGGNDYLQGDGGGDQLDGGAGIDRLLGGVGNDILEGGSENDTLDGGLDNDTLKGGEGLDRYISNFGADSIEDSDGKGVVEFDNKILVGGLRRNGEPANVFHCADGTLTFTIIGTDLQVTGSGFLTIKNFVNGQFGIRLVSEADSTPAIRTEFQKVDHFIQVGNLPDGTPIYEPVYAAFFDDNGNDTRNTAPIGGLIPGIGEEHNLIYALGGNDFVLSGMGDDQLYGGGGNDEIYGGLGNDRLYGGAEDDQLYGDDAAGSTGGGNDYLDGGEGNDAIQGGAGRDIVLGGGGNDQLEGDDPDSIQLGIYGNDYLDGGDGDEELHGGGGADVLIGGAGNDFLLGDAAISQGGTPDAGGGDSLDGGSGNDWLDGQFGDDLLVGGLGQDTLNGGDGADVLLGGDGNDQLSGDLRFEYAVTELVFAMSEYRGAGGADWLIGGQGFDYLTGGDGADILEGNDDNDVLFGDYDPSRIPVGFGAALHDVGGNDILDGGAGADALYGGVGDDDLDGGSGDDSLEGGTGADILLGGVGNDTLEGEAGNDFLDGGAGIDRLDGGAGFDTIYGGEGDDRLEAGSRTIGSSGSQTFSVAAFSSEPVSEGAELLLVSEPAGVDQLFGDAGNDDLISGNENLDTDDSLLAGGPGDDTYEVDSPGDVVVESAEGGNDTVISYISHRLSDHVENLALRGLMTAGVGNNLNNVVTGGNWLEGLAGDDVLTGAGRLDGGVGDDVLHGQSGISFFNDDTGQLEYLANTYIFRLGDGRDTIQENDALFNSAYYQNEDTVLFADGLAPSDVTWERAGNDLNLHIGGGADQITVVSFYDLRLDRGGYLLTGAYMPSDGEVFTPGGGLSAYVAPSRVERMQFSDGTVWNADHFGAPLLGDFRANTYRFGRGSGEVAVLDLDVTQSNLDREQDRILIGAGVSPGEVTLARTNGDDLVLSIDGTNDRLTIQSFFKTVGVTPPFSSSGYSAAAYRVEQVQFADGTLWTVSDLFNRISTFAGTSGPDTLFGNPLDNLIQGLSGDDYLSGQDGDDRLDGGAGNDRLVGDAGDDIYIFGREGGQDILVSYDASGTNTDVVRLGADVLPSDVTIQVVGSSNDLVVRINGTADQLLLDEFLWRSEYQIDRLIFGDGTVWDTGMILGRAIGLTLTGTEADNALRGSVLDDVLVGLGGNDVLVGNAGDDQLAGGLGDDILSGDEGHDTYLFTPGDGIDTIYDDVTLGGANRILFGLGIGSGDLVFLQAGTTLTITVGSGGDRIVLEDFDPLNQDGSLVVSTLEFADGSVVDLAELFPPNQAPMLSVPLVDQTVREHVPFTFVVPPGAFADNDPSDVLTLSASLADGMALPAWLAFDPATATFSGTADDAHVGSLDLRVTATDSGNLTASDVVTLTVMNVNEAPTVTTLLADQIAVEDAAFSFTIPASTFVDVDRVQGDQLSYSATLADGSLLPTWLSFDPISRTFSGTPDNNNVGTLAPAVTATDQGNLSASTGFSLVIQNVNDAPTVAMPIADQTAAEDDPFLFTVPGTTFADADVIHGDMLTYNATLADGNPLPAWLSFNPTTRTFSGTPDAGNAGTMLVEVTASDAGYLSARDEFAIAISGPLPKTFVGTEGNDVLTGARGDDTLSGLGGTDVLSGGEGNDLLDGGRGADAMTGGKGDDIYIVDVIDDVVTELASEGTDTVRTGLLTYTLGSHIENLTLTGSSTSAGAGNALNNLLLGNEGANLLLGGDGNDVLQGGGGSDVLEGGAGVDTLAGGADNDMLMGGVGNDVYRFYRGDGQDAIRDKDTTAGNSDRLAFGTTINPLDLVLERQANDLRLQIHGASEGVTIQNWYSAGATNQIETLQAGNGQILLNTQVEQLIQAMASFSQQTGLTWDQAIDQRPQDVQAVLAASWQ